MIIHRRKLLTGLASLVAAPAIVRVQSVMPVRSLAEESFTDLVVKFVDSEAGYPIGTQGMMWNELFLASGNHLNFNKGDVWMLRSEIHTRVP